MLNIKLFYYKVTTHIYIYIRFYEYLDERVKSL